jgi:hypothetical protein
LISKKDELNKNGFIKINFNQKQELIEKIKSQFERQIKDSSKIFYEQGNSKKIFLKNPLEIKEIFQLHNIFKDIINEYYDGNYEVYKISCWRTLYDKSRETQKEDYVFSNYWHFDDFNCGNLKVFVLMNEFTDQNSGSTKLINKRNSKYLTRSLRFLDTSISNFSLNKFVKKRRMIINCDGKLGDTYVVNSSKCLHSASIPQKGKYRDLIQFEISFSNSVKTPFENLLQKN